MARVALLGLWEREICPLSERAALEHEFGRGAGLALFQRADNWPVAFRRWVETHRRIKAGVDGRYRWVKR